MICFWAYKVTLDSDVKKVFLVIVVDEKDGDVLKFLWLDGKPMDDPEIRAYKFTRVVYHV